MITNRVVVVGCEGIVGGGGSVDAGEHTVEGGATTVVDGGSNVVVGGSDVVDGGSNVVVGGSVGDGKLVGVGSQTVVGGALTIVVGDGTVDGGKQIVVGSLAPVAAEPARAWEGPVRPMMRTAASAANADATVREARTWVCPPRTHELFRAIAAFPSANCLAFAPPGRIIGNARN